MEALKTYLKEVRTIPLLTAAEEIVLSKRIRKNDDEQARKKMIRSNLRLVINIAKKYIHLGIPLLDLIEEGNLGLMKAVDKYDPLKGFRFSTYGAWWIRQGIIRAIAQQGKMVRLPVYINELLTKWKKTKEQLTQKLHRVPTDEDIAKRMKISKVRVEEINLWLSTTTSSLEAPIGDEEENQVLDLVENQNVVQPDEAVEKVFDRERLESLLGDVRISERERQVLDMRVGLSGGKQHTLAEIAKKLKVSRERVRQIEEEALKKLGKFAREQEKS
jgi:RNA polymerase primary sigma factor